MIVGYVLAWLFLLSCSITDYKTGKVPHKMVFLWLFFALPFFVIFNFSLFEVVAIVISWLVLDRINVAGFLGGGDVNMIFVTFLFIGFSGVLISLFISSLFAGVFMLFTGKKAVRFAPFFFYGLNLLFVAFPHILYIS